jgi:nucleoside-diphosphate-sugar epimerase
MEQLLEKSRAERNLKYSIVRMPDFYGPFVVNRFSEQLYINALKGKKMQWIGHLDTEIELIFIEDAGEALAMVSLDENSDGQTYNIPGTAITTAQKYLEEIVVQAGSQSEITTMNSDWLFRIGGLFMPLAGEVFEMLYLKREKLILDGTKFKKHFGHLPNTAYSAGIEKTLDWAKSFFKLRKKQI